MTFYNLRIHEIQEKMLINFKCELGHKRLVETITDDDLYCLQCKRAETVFQTSYKLQLSAINMGKLDTFILYDGGVEELIGCSSDQFYQYMKSDASLVMKLEYHLRNRYCHITQKGKKQQRTKSNAIISEKIELSPNIKLIDLLLNPKTKYDDTLEMLIVE